MTNVFFLSYTLQYLPVFLFQEIWLFSIISCLPSTLIYRFIYIYMALMFWSHHNNITNGSVTDRFGDLGKKGEKIATFL